MTILKYALFSSLALMLSVSSALASDPVQQHNSNAVWFENWGRLTNATLTIVAPDGQITELFTASGTPVFQLSGNEVLDGIYNYELSAATEKQVKIINSANNGRGDAARDSAAKPYNAWGAFTVERGVIITPEDISEDSN